MALLLNLGGLSLDLDAPSGSGSSSSSNWLYLGAYDNGVSYNTSDVVLYNGGLWYCYTSANLSAGYPPDSRPECWVQVSSTTSSGNPFDQSLNTSDSPTFSTLVLNGNGYDNPLTWANGASVLMYDGSIDFGTGDAHFDISGYVQAGLGQVQITTNDVPDESLGGLFVGCGFVSNYTQGYDAKTVLHYDGSASFANGAASIDANGNAEFAGLTVNGSPVGGTGFNQSLNTTDSPTFSTITIGTYEGSLVEISESTIVIDGGRYVGGITMLHGDISALNIDVANGSHVFNSDGSAQFANGGLLVDVFGSASFGGQYYYNGGGPVVASINAQDGSASFANGAAGFDASGNTLVHSLNLDPNADGPIASITGDSTTHSLVWGANTSNAGSLDYGGGATFGIGNGAEVNGVYGYGTRISPTGGIELDTRGMGCDRDQSASLRWSNGLGKLGTDGSASFANGTCTIDNNGNFRASDGYFESLSSFGSNLQNQIAGVADLTISGSDLYVSSFSCYSLAINSGFALSSSSDNSVTSKIAITVNGTTYYLLASTSAS